MAKQDEQTPTPARQGGRQLDNPLMSLREEMDRVFDRFVSGRFWQPGGLWDSNLGSSFGFSFSSPKLDVVEKDKEVVVTAELPGIQENEVELTLEEGVLTIRGEKKTEDKREEGRTVISERSFGSFERRLPLPEGIDEEKCSASFDNGVLTVRLQRKPDAGRQARRIPIGK